MPKYLVTVEKTLYCSGTVEVEAKDCHYAFFKVKDMIDAGELQTTDIEWDDPEYNDCSFGATGDIDVI
jgi:hypothetical protein